MTAWVTVREYEQFATSFTTIRAPDIATQVREIYDSKRYWPEPLIQITPNYLKSKTVAEFVAAGQLAPAKAQQRKITVLTNRRKVARSLLFTPPRPAGPCFDAELLPSC